MRKCTLLLIATMLILPTQLTAQTTEGYIPANLGRIVEVATPNGILSRPHVLIGWDTNGFVKQANSENTYKLFGLSPYSTALNTGGITFNKSGYFGSPSGHDAIEIRFGDSSYCWLSSTFSGGGGSLSAVKAPFSVFHVGPRPAKSSVVTGGYKLCFSVYDENQNGVYTPGEMIYVFGDLSLPVDSAYEQLGSNATNPFTYSPRYLWTIRFGNDSIPYTSNDFNLFTDGILPPPGTVIRFVPQTADTAAPYFTIKDITQDTGTHSHSNLISYYSYEKPQYELINAPPRMTIDTNGVISWTTYLHQIGNVRQGLLKVSNSYGETYNTFNAVITENLSADSGIVEYKTETSGNRIRFWQRNEGSIAYRRINGYFGMEYPIGTNYSFIYAAGFYIGGLKEDANGVYDTMTVSNCEFYSEYQPGRILNTGPFGGLIAGNFKASETFFALSFNQHNWPREAPKNSMGLPLQLSGNDTWTVFNDLDLTMHSRDNQDENEFSPGLGLEVQRQTFQYAHYPFNNAVLVRYVVINRSNREYDSCYIGLWNDPDVGEDSGDDLTSVDSALSLMTVYSNPAGDPNWMDDSRTALGIHILQGPVDMGNTTDTARIQTIGKNGFESKHIPHKVNRMANSAKAGLKTAGSPSRLSGDRTRWRYMKGLDALGNVKPGGPFDLGPWALAPGDQRVMISTGPFNFAASDTQEVWMAYIGGQGVNNAAAVDTVRHYAEWIMNDFKNNQIYKFDQTSPALSLHALNTQAVNRVRFIINTDEPLMQTILRTNNDTLKLSAIKNGYFADYNISKTGSIYLTLTGKDIAGNVSTITKTYQVTSLNKSAVHGKYTFHPDGQGYLIMSKTETVSIPDKCMMIGEPVEWIVTQNNGSMKVEFTYSNSDLAKIQSRYEEFDIMNLGLYSWDGEQWEPVETNLSSNKLSGMAKGSMMAVFYNPESNNTPKRFSLEPNYPNPFNPTTTIRYQLAENSKVTLKIYNLLGQEVKTLVNTQQSNGMHTALWDGTNNHGRRVTSGVYFYRLQAGDFVKTRKMVLVK